MKKAFFYLFMIGFIFILIGIGGKANAAPGQPESIEGMGGIVILPILIFIGYLIWGAIKRGLL